MPWAGRGLKLAMLIRSPLWSCLCERVETLEFTLDSHNSESVGPFVAPFLGVAPTVFSHLLPDTH